MTTRSTEILKFLDFELDAGAAELRRAGASIDVEPQVFALIAFLARNPGRVVTRDELIENIWRGRIVSDSAISTRINAARRALGDSGDEQSIIRTVRGRGFRFELYPTSRTEHADSRNMAVAGNDQPALPLPEQPSIAVLPFDSGSRSEQDEFFADGVTEEVIIGLSRLRSLFVIGRNSSFSYKNEPHNSTRISAELGVRYLVTGGIRRAGKQIRVSAQLVDATNGRQIWSDKIDQDSEDVLVAQESIAQTVVSSVQTQVLLNEGELSEQKAKRRQGVSDLLNRAWRATAEWTEEGLLSALSLGGDAAAAEPGNARAYVVISLARYGMGYLGYADDLKASLREGLIAAREAVRLAPNDEYSHWVFACCAWCSGDHDLGVSHARRAIEISPNFSWAHGTMGTALAWSGDYHGAIDKTNTALRYNPRDTTIYFRHLVLALSHYGLRRYDEALEFASRVINQKPDWWLGHAFSIASLAAMDREGEAKRAIIESRHYVPIFTRQRLLALPFKSDDERRHLSKALSQVGTFDEIYLDGK